jgi:diguanylate cyclase (GGDEF)-like protein/PAS domain S-box-containing protein
MSKTPKQPDTQQLRKIAEEKLGRTKLNLVHPRPGEELLHELLQELSVHQIELEMQNEALRQAQVVIEESRDRYLDLYDFAPVGYLTLNREGMISEINLTGTTLLGMERKKLLQRRFAPLVSAADRAGWERFFVGMFKHDERQHCELSLKRSDNAQFHAYLDCLRMESAGLSSLRITLTDITERRLQEESMREKEEFFRIIAEYTEDFIAVLDLEGRRVYNNSTYNRLFGAIENKKGTDSFAEIHPDDRKHIMQVFKETVRSGTGMRTDFRFMLPDGSIRHMESRGGLVKNSQNQPSRVVVISRDITERKLAEQKIHNLAFYDLLTRLPNRRLLNDRLSQTITSSKRSARFAALMFIDLDNFKPLNDGHGHAAGDLLLQEAARRISGCVREADTVARFGGDEFVVILNEMAIDKAGAIAEAGVVAEKIRLALEQPYLLTVQQAGKAVTIRHNCTSSIGVVVFSDNEYSAEDIIKHADMAMYRAKNQGRNRVRFFDPDLRQPS